MAYASLVSTKDALDTVADAAVDTFIIMIPSLNPEGLNLVQQLFARTRAPNRRLIVPRAGDGTRIVPDDAAQLALGVEAFDYTIDASDGFETFHASR